VLSAVANAEHSVVGYRVELAATVAAADDVPVAVGAHADAW
jgi:hypothetical protein